MQCPILDDKQFGSIIQSETSQILWQKAENVVEPWDGPHGFCSDTAHITSTHILLIKASHALAES